MSGTESLPYGESKSPPVGETGHELRLHRGVLGIVDISAATMANIGPPMSFYFGFGFLAITAGVASPLTIVAAGIAIALLGNTLAQFSRAQPSTGGFITFVGKTFGGTSAVTTALLCGVGYIIAMASVIAISGGFLSITLQRYAHVNIPWGYLTVILTALAVLMMIRGVGLSTKIAGLFFGFEMLVLTGALNPINFFAESSTMGTILVLVVYLLANLALPFCYRRFRPQEFRAVKHGVLPVLGAIAIIVPLYYLAKPGQPTPYDWFPYAALIIVVVGAVYAYILNSRDPGLAARVGSIVADE
jgi:amino acid transporter